ncbi:MAG: ABC transporter permease [Proteobacteria bacterium]|nr:ABC transporter permease [Pseudomonadota bacterium]
MNITAIRALIRNDLRLYRSDRRAVIVGILMPILIAAFFGYLFGQNSSDEEAGKVPIAVVDEDGSAITRAIITQIAGDSMLQVTPLAREAAREQVRKGTQQAAAIFPKGFGEQSVAALFTGRDKPHVELFVDPSQAMSSGWCRECWPSTPCRRSAKRLSTARWGARTCSRCWQS